MLNLLNADSKLKTKSKMDEEQGHDTSSEESVLQREKK
jgi:hypothetical protein